MNVGMRQFVFSCFAFVFVFAYICQSVRADVSPPVSIDNVDKETLAVAGQEYQGQFAIHAYQAGELSDFRISGEGWEFKSTTLPKSAVQAKAGIMTVKFTAVPDDPDQPLAFSFDYNGRLVRKVFHVGPEFQARKKQAQVLIHVPNSSGVRPGASVAVDSETKSSEGGAVPLQVVGRIVYDRPGNDQSSPPDGDFDDPGDVPPATLGADTIRVTLLDADLLQVETIWTGFTDENGYFDTGLLYWDDCDPIFGCDVPDLVLKVDAYTQSSGAVLDENGDVYEFFQPEMTDFADTYFDYGVLKPPAGMMPAIHILNNINRARRFTGEELGMVANGVIAYWPDDSRGDAAWYNPGSQAIHLSTARQWRTDSIIHEYGHHHNNHFYGSPRPDPNYCDPEMDCDPDPANNSCGHCLWCDENAVDAWFEGWADWFADVVTRSFPDRYAYDDGTPFDPLFTRDLETPQPCGGSYDDPVKTEGFVGALLRDIEDQAQDDHDDDPDPSNATRDGIFDSLCTGPGKVAFLTYAYDPINVIEFLSGYLDDYPNESNLLWPTAYNVGGSAFVSMFPADAQPPGKVTTLDSPTHPLGVGGGLACMTFAFEPPDDDVTGANVYSYVVSEDPAGVEPDEGADPVRPGDNCDIEFTVPIYHLGEYYVSIKAQDNAGNWSSQWETFGPFEVLDCNNSGQLDVCDIDCSVTAIPGMCNFGISPCGSVFTCTEVSNDCNGNWEPDECDVASRKSEDCDVNGVPDECQPMKHYTGGKGNPDQNKWEERENWLEDRVPVDQDYVCVPAESDGNAVVYKESGRTISSLASYKDFVVSSDGDHPSPDLGMNYNSFVLGDFQMSGNSTLTIDTRLYVDGKFFWFGGTIDGNGLMDVSNGLSLTPSSVNLNGADFLLRNGGADTSTRVNMNYGATFKIDQNANYNYSGDNYIFYGSNGKVTVRGALTREAGSGTATVVTPLDNEGTVHLKTGELYLAYPGTHTGAFNGDPGTVLKLSGANGTQEFLPASSISAPTVQFAGGTGNIHGSVDISELIQGRGGTWTFADDANIVNYGPEVHVNLGKVVFEAPTDQPVDFDKVTVTNSGQQAGQIYFDTGMPFNIGTFSILAGGINGSSPINVGGTFTWTNGSIQGSGAITANGPVVINSTSSSRTLYRVLNINDQANIYSGFGLGGSAAINIVNNAVVNLQFDHGAIGTRTINNYGTILRTSGAGAISLSAAVNNSGLIHNQTGVLSLSGGGTHVGDLLADPGSELQIAGQNHDFQSSSTITTPVLNLKASNSSTHGSVNITDAMVCEGSDWTFESDANIINYGDQLTIIYGQLHLNAPTDRAVDFDTVDLPSNFYGYSLYFDTGMPINIDTFNMINNGNIYGSSPIDVTNQFTWTNGTFVQGGLLRCDGDTTVNSTSSSRTMYRPWDNYGNMTVKGTFGTSPSGPITNKPGAVMDLQYENRAIGGTGVITNEGTLLKTTTSGFAGLPYLVNTGTVDIQMGSLQFHTSYVDYTQTAGETILNDTSIEMFLDNRPIHLEGGVFRGNGSVVGDIENTGGTVSPGFSAGEIEVDDYTQSGTGVLDIEIEGTNPGEYDVLTVDGTATLGGELRVTDVSPFVPQSGDRIVILTAANVSGTFDTENVPVHYTVAYTPTEVALEVAGPSPDLNGDGFLDLLDYTLLQACYAGPNQPPSANCEPGVDADLDVDGDVDGDDYARWFTALNQ